MERIHGPFTHIREIAPDLHVTYVITDTMVDHNYWKTEEFCSATEDWLGELGVKVICQPGMTGPGGLKIPEEDHLSTEDCEELRREVNWVVHHIAYLGAPPMA